VKTIAQSIAGSVNEAHKEWGWYLVLGLAWIATGAYALYSVSAATIASIIVLGAILCIAGVFQLVAAVFARGAGHIILALLVGALDLIVGLMLIQHPGAGAFTVTLLLAVLFVFAGLYRFVSSLALQFPNYGWVAFSGVITFALGVLLWLQWPVSAEWFIGFVVGLNFIFAGISWSGIALRLKSIVPVSV
jgi:uncharacterized membrane protein HdeD (DUF308 family)